MKPSPGRSEGQRGAEPGERVLAGAQAEDAVAGPRRGRGSLGALQRSRPRGRRGRRCAAKGRAPGGGPPGDPGPRAPVGPRLGVRGREQQSRCTGREGARPRRPGGGRARWPRARAGAGGGGGGTGAAPYPAATGPAPLWPFYAAGLLPRAGGVRCKRSRRTAARRRLGAPRPSPFSGRGPTRAAAAGRGGAARARPGPAPRGGRGRDGGSGPGSPSAPLPPEMRGRCPCRGSRPS